MAAMVIAPVITSHARCLLLHSASWLLLMNAIITRSNPGAYGWTTSHMFADSAATAAGAGDAGAVTMRVEGRVYCDVCGVGYFSRSSSSIKNAEVRAWCVLVKGNESTSTRVEKGRTDHEGLFSIPVSLQSINESRAAAAALIASSYCVAELDGKSPLSHCNLHMKPRSSSAQLPPIGGGDHVADAGLLSWRPHAATCASFFGRLQAAARPRTHRKESHQSTILVKLAAAHPEGYYSGVAPPTGVAKPPRMPSWHAPPAPKNAKPAPAPPFPGIGEGPPSPVYKPSPVIAPHVFPPPPPPPPHKKPPPSSPPHPHPHPHPPPYPPSPPPYY